jgi:hypothetical protein
MDHPGAASVHTFFGAYALCEKRQKASSFLSVYFPPARMEQLGSYRKVKVKIKVKIKIKLKVKVKVKFILE